MIVETNCHVHVAAQERPACKATVPGIAYCQKCGSEMCPVCGRHNVVQLSRVTGYISAVSGWNNGKKQELLDRKHYDLR